MGKNQIKFYSFVERLTVTNYYNLNGDLITMGTKDYENVNVTIVRKIVKIMGDALEEHNIIVNGEIVGYNVISAKGNSKNLSVCVCDDAG